MRNIAIETDTLANGWTVVMARIPPRVCGAPNVAAANRIRELIGTVNAAAFDPLPEAVAEAVIRDACPYTSPPGLIEQREAPPVMYAPPNCDGNQSAVPRANFPPFVTDDREDDEGEAIHGYPPGVACNITGECE